MIDEIWQEISTKSVDMIWQGAGRKRLKNCTKVQNRVRLTYWTFGQYNSNSRTGDMPCTRVLILNAVDVITTPLEQASLSWSSMRALEARNFCWKVTTLFKRSSWTDNHLPSDLQLRQFVLEIPASHRVAVACSQTLLQLLVVSQ